LLEQLKGTFHRLRQRSIDEELFDVISGFEALSNQDHHKTPAGIASNPPPDLTDRRSTL
jgi:hypothetical protein